MLKNFNEKTKLETYTLFSELQSSSDFVAVVSLVLKWKYAIKIVIASKSKIVVGAKKISNKWNAMVDLASLML